MQSASVEAYCGVLVVRVVDERAPPMAQFSTFRLLEGGAAFMHVVAFLRMPRADSLWSIGDGDLWRK